MTAEIRGISLIDLAIGNLENEFRFVTIEVTAETTGGRTDLGIAAIDPGGGAGVDQQHVDTTGTENETDPGDDIAIRVPSGREITGATTVIGITTIVGTAAVIVTGTAGIETVIGTAMIIVDDDIVLAPGHNIETVKENVDVVIAVETDTGTASGSKIVAASVSVSVSESEAGSANDRSRVYQALLDDAHDLAGGLAPVILRPAFSTSTATCL